MSLVFRCPYPLSCLESENSFKHSVNGWAGIAGVYNERTFQKLYLGTRLEEGASASNRKLIIQNLGVML